MSNQILILGGTGYVGSHIGSALSCNPDARRVIVGARKPVSLADGVEFRAVDASDTASLEKGLQGITHIVNCVMGDAGVMLAVARNVAAVAAKLGVHNVVHLSSTAVYGSLSGTLDETSEVGKGVDWYGAVKLESEHIIKAAQGGGLSIVVLRPALIYGPGSSQWTLRIGRLLAEHRLGDLVGRGEGLCNLVHVRDVATAVCNALFRPEAAGRIFNLAAPNPVTWNRYLTDLGDALGLERCCIPAWKLDLESKLLAYPFKVMELLMPRLGFGSVAPAVITPSLVGLLGQRVRYHSDAADVLMPSGWIPYDAGISESAAWTKSVMPGRFR